MYMKWINHEQFEIISILRHCWNIIQQYITIRLSTIIVNVASNVANLCKLSLEPINVKLNKGFERFQEIKFNLISGNDQPIVVTYQPTVQWQLLVTKLNEKARLKSIDSRMIWHFATICKVFAEMFRTLHSKQNIYLSIFINKMLFIHIVYFLQRPGI